MNNSETLQRLTCEHKIEIRAALCRLARSGLRLSASSYLFTAAYAENTLGARAELRERASSRYSYTAERNPLQYTPPRHRSRLCGTLVAFYLNCMRCMVD